MVKNWRDAALWAMIAAILLEITISILTERTLWHRVTAIEHCIKASCTHE